MSHPLLTQLGRGHAAITASAGTGKTHFLEQLVLDEVARGQALDRILIVTYTKKGAMELKERLRAALQKGEGANRMRARRELERATLATIHSFCQQALQEEAFHAGRAFQSELAPAGALRARAVREAMRKGLVGPDVEAWIQAMEKKGPGELEETLADLIPALAILEPTEQELEAVIAPFRDPDLYAALGAAREGLKKASSKRSLAEFVDQVVASRAQVGDARSFHLSSKGWKKLENAWSDAVPPAIREAATRLQKFNIEALHLRPLAEAAARELAAIKASEGLVDFDDLIHQLRATLEGPGGDQLAERLSSRFDLCLLDEAQDTSEAQWAILWRLFKDKRLVLVGDAKQAIFSYQGGDLPAFLAARKTLLDAGGAEGSLTENWRSTAEMVEACNALLGLGTEAPMLIEPADPVQAFTAADLAPAMPCPAPAEWADPMPAVVALPVPFYRTKEEAAPASAKVLAEALKALVQSGPRFRPRKEILARPLAYADIFVLVRDKDGAEMMADALREASVPFVQHKARGLFEGEVAADLHALFRALEDPRDASARMRAYLTPFFGVPLAEAQGAADLDEGHPLPRQLSEWEALAREGRTAALFDRVLGGGIVTRLLSEPGGQRRVADLLHLVELLQEAAGPCDNARDHARRLARWREGEDRPKEEEESVRRVEQEGDAVSILTFHAAKGLQAPVVALFEMGERSGKGLQPYHRPSDHGWERRVWAGDPAAAPEGASPQAESRAEERRLLYVGLTRAEGLLLLPVHDLPGPDEKPPAWNSSFEKDWIPKGAYGHLQRAVLAWKDRAPWLHWGLPPLPATSPAPSSAPLILPPPFPFDAVKAKAWPPRVESFTSLHRRVEAEAGAKDPEPDRLPRSEGLPGGTATGIALHRMLETADPATFDLSFSKWWTEARRAWAERACEVAGLDPRWAEAAAKLAHAGLGTPLRLSQASPIPFAKLDLSRIARELDFLAAMPGGRLTGALDALFEHGGRVHLLDWKSNLLPDYGEASVAACVEEDYRLQVKVYTLAALRFLHIEDEAAYEARFGGVVYVFLRGLPEGGQWAQRPSWRETRAWAAELERMLEPVHA
ncbi:MAG: UvrD-helicase domain-containing protein [Acidobacteria bacterium]|nr:UvrD-helicase domain-containing protein [Acidobacteriota bacterium]